MFWSWSSEHCSCNAVGPGNMVECMPPQFSWEGLFPSLPEVNRITAIFDSCQNQHPPFAPTWIQIKRLSHSQSPQHSHLSLHHAEACSRRWSSPWPLTSVPILTPRPFCLPVFAQTHLYLHPKFSYFLRLMLMNRRNNYLKKKSIFMSSGGLEWETWRKIISYLGQWCQSRMHALSRSPEKSKTLYDGALA